MKILQTPETFAERTADQVANGEVDTGQYHGKTAASAWQAVAESLQYTSYPKFPIHSPTTVVDIGTGTGEPLLQISKNWQRLRSVLVDVSQDILIPAQERISKAGEVESIAADVVRDFAALKKELDVYDDKTILMIGNTIANCRQAIVLPLLREMLGKGERLIIGVKLFMGEQRLQKAGEFFASEKNCTFGTAFLKDAGDNTSLRNNFAYTGEDHEEKGVYTIDGYHINDEDRILTFYPHTALLPAGFRLRYVRSRQYDIAYLEDLLNKYGLAVEDIKAADGQVFALCKKD